MHKQHDLDSSQKLRSVVCFPLLSNSSSISKSNPFGKTIPAFRFDSIVGGSRNIGLLISWSFERYRCWSAIDLQGYKRPLSHFSLRLQFQVMSSRCVVARLFSSSIAYFGALTFPVWASLSISPLVSPPFFSTLKHTIVFYYPQYTLSWTQRRHTSPVLSSIIYRPERKFLIKLA